jgi:general secretion pathway protein D
MKSLITIKANYWGLFLAIIMFMIMAMELIAQDAAMTVAEGRNVDTESIKRLEKSLLYNKQIEEASKLLAAGELKSARDRFKSVMDSTEQEPVFRETNLLARRGVATVLAQNAAIAETAKDYAAARASIEEALALDPSNVSYQQTLLRLKPLTKSLSEKFDNNAAVTPELQEKVGTIQKLMFEGDAFMQTGQYQRAIGRYKEIVSIDPYNDNARKRIEKVEKLKYKASTMRRDARRENALNDVTRDWATTPAIRKPMEVATSGQTNQDAGSLKILDKLEAIRIPELNFSEVDIADAVKFLEEQSKALDPEKKGINFVLKAESTVAAVSTPVRGSEPAAAPAPVASRALTLSLKDVPLIEVLNFIKSLTNLQYKVDQYAVYLFPSNETSDVFLIKNFSVPPTFFPNSVKETNTAKGDFTTRTVEIATVPVKEELEKKGVKFASGASAAYLPRTAKMVVKNTLEQLNLIDQLLSREVNQTKQIEVETKFIEFSDDKLRELTSNFRVNGPAIPSIAGLPEAFGLLPNNTTKLNPGITPNNGIAPDASFGDVEFQNIANISSSTALRTSGSLSPNSLDGILGIGQNRAANQIGVSGIIGGSGARLLITALESTLGSDLMSAPKLTLINGQKSKIRIARELLYPTEYDAPKIITASGGGTSSVSQSTAVPANPTSFETRDVGVTLEVKATATSDRRIDLELKPEVTEFQGFINYGGDVNQLSTVQDSPLDPTLIAEGVALAPVFAIRRAETKLQVIDGRTVVMGGFIREDKQQIDDKVPILGDIPLVGRLFRSKVDKSVKRNLIMLVTARMMRPDGTPEFLTEGEREAFEVTVLPQEQAK